MNREYNVEYRRRNFIHIKMFLLSILLIFFGIKTLSIDTDRISIVQMSRVVFFVTPLIIGIFANIYLGLIVFKSKLLKNLDKTIKIIYRVMLFVSLFYIIEYIGLPIIQSFIDTSSLTRIPGKDNFLNSITYIILNHSSNFLKGILMTLLLSLTGTVIGLILAFIFVIIRTQDINIRDNEVLVFIKSLGIKFVKVYVNVFRGTPMMVQAVLIYYLLPMFIASTLGVPQSSVDRIFTITLSGIIIVSLNTTAYLVEVLRGGIEAIDKGQMEAARSLGLTYKEAMFKIILPQAIKNVLPSIINEFIINIKDTSVLNIIGVAELFFIANDVKQKYFRTYEPFVIAGLIYLVLTLTTSKLLVVVEKKLSLSETPLPSSN